MSWNPGGWGIQSLLSLLLNVGGDRLDSAAMKSKLVGFRKRASKIKCIAISLDNIGTGRPRFTLNQSTLYFVHLELAKYSK